MTYEQYINSSHWKHLRKEALQRWGNRCHFDPMHRGQIHVHHLQYRKDLKDCDAYDLVPLCEDCHNELHKNKASLDSLAIIIGWSRNLRHSRCTQSAPSARSVTAISKPTKKSKKQSKSGRDKVRHQESLKSLIVERDVITAELRGLLVFKIEYRHLAALKTNGAGVSNYVSGFLGKKHITRKGFKKHIEGKFYKVKDFMECLQLVQHREATK